MAVGKFITLEGMDGAGKSTHIPNIVSQIESHGETVVCTREPGGTTLAEELREILLHKAMHAETETLLMFAARREHIAKVIAPAMARGDCVISDRFTDKITVLEKWVQDELQPDMTILFDVPVEVSIARLASARTPDKFEREDAEFFEKLRNAYLARAKQYPTRFRIINANQPLKTVAKEVKVTIEDFILRS